jgi:hypothetical protein
MLRRPLGLNQSLPGPAPSRSSAEMAPIPDSRIQPPEATERGEAPLEAMLRGMPVQVPPGASQCRAAQARVHDDGKASSPAAVDMDAI